jgi:soluble lytic murein transglycosylase-like protein
MVCGLTKLMEVIMTKSIQAAIVAIALLFSMAFPAFAQTAEPTKNAAVHYILKETKNKVSLKDAVRIVNAAFKEAAKHSFDPLLVLAIMKPESTYNVSARSREGARGLMQVIPRWHRDKIKGRNINHIETNVEVGTQIFADCLDNQKGYIKKAFKCYSSNARNYRAKVETVYKQLQKAEIQYRFENDMPIDALPRFEESTKFPISLNAEQALALQ